MSKQNTSQTEPRNNSADALPVAVGSVQRQAAADRKEDEKKVKQLSASPKKGEVSADAVLKKVPAI